jgi:RNA-directed DNA polymerase
MKQIAMLSVACRGVALRGFLTFARGSKRVEQDKSGSRSESSNSGSRTANFNNTPWNSNWNISLRAAGGNWKMAGEHVACPGALVSLFYLLRQIRLGVRRATSRVSRKSRRHIAMGKKYKNLFPLIVAPDNLYAAYRKAAKGKRHTRSHLDFASNLRANLEALGERLRTGVYQPGTPRVFLVHEPKTREITAMPFVDRVAQHALCGIVDPIFDRVFMPQSYACRKGKGTHAAARDVQAELRRMKAAGIEPWVLKTDFSKYFYSIRREVLHAEMQRKISCRPTLALLKTVIPATGAGLPIGNLTSQMSANIYGHVVDRWLAHTMGIVKFFRYMDDIVVVGRCRHELARLQAALGAFAQDTLGLKFSHWSIQPAARGVNFVGYRIWSTYKLLRGDSVLRAKRKIRRYTKHGEAERLRVFLASWKGHAKWADSNNLLSNLGVA